MLLYYLGLLSTEEEKSKFEALYYEYRALMKYIALDILKNEYLAEDAVHDSFIKLVRHLDAVGEIESYKTKNYVSIIVKNVSLDMIKKEKKKQSFIFDYQGKSYSSDNEIFDNIEVEEIYALIKSLPDIYRDILELKVYYNLSNEQLADMLGISNQAVRKRLERARNALKKLLEERGIMNVLIANK